MIFPHRNFIHVSDLHFGRTDVQVIDAFERFVKENPIDLLLVTGDMTQRATRSQFMQAAAFFKRLPVQRICAIPGNHDMPLHNLYGRFVKPLDGYRKYISPLVQDQFHDDDIWILGLDTQNRFSIKEGRLSHRQLKTHENFLQELGQDPRLKIILSHHSLYDARLLKPRYRERRDRVLALHPHLLLSGHNHQAAVVRRSRAPEDLFPLEIKAGTGVSSRTREEPNSFNWIEIRPDVIRVQVHDYDAPSQHFLPTLKRSHDIHLSDTLKQPDPASPAAGQT